MSSMCGLRPRFSWTTSTPGSLPVAVGRAAPDSRASCRSPAATGTRRTRSSSRASSLATCCASANFGLSCVEQHRGGHAADGVLGGLVEEAAPVERAVHVRVEQDEHFGIEIGGGLAFHGRPPRGHEHTGRAVRKTIRRALTRLAARARARATAELGRPRVTLPARRPAGAGRAMSSPLSSRLSRLRLHHARAQRAPARARAAPSA